MPVIAAQLTYNSRGPIDKREIVETIAERNAIAYPYAGLEVWVNATSKKYRCTGLNGNTANWVDITQVQVDLTNYYTKDEVDSIIENVNQFLENIHSLEVVAVDALPSQDISSSTIYLVPQANSEANNVKDEYIYVNGLGWEKIGSTQIDLTNYATKDYVNNAVSNLHPVSITATEVDDTDDEYQINFSV